MKQDQRVALVTGAAGSFGKAIVHNFLTLGMTVHCIDREKRDLDAIFEQYKTLVGTCYTHVVDLTNLEAMSEMLNSISEVDILVNCAGICSGTTIWDMTASEWDTTYAVNVRAPFFLSQKIAQRMISSPCLHKRIVNISSLVSFTGGIRSSAAYSSSKGALSVTTKNFAKALAPYGITVNEVAPGTADTALARGFLGDTMNDFKNQIPLNRLCEPVDVAQAVKFLVSDESSFITGQVLHVDGGMYIK